MDTGIDTGDIVATKKVPIEPNDQAVDVLSKANKVTLNCSMNI
jgi:methionyl-tRNA formyltransferase